MSDVILHDDSQWQLKIKNGRKYYYRNDKRVPVREVPSVVLNKMRTKKVEYVPVAATYLEALPRDLIRSLVLYMPTADLKRLKDTNTFKAVCQDESFWYQVIINNFTTRPKVNDKHGNFKSWLNAYFTYKSIANKKELSDMIDSACAYNLGKLIHQHIDKITDPELFYYILVRLLNFGNENLDLVKYIIEEKRVDWPTMYQQGRQTYMHNKWESLENKYKLYLHTKYVCGPNDLNLFIYIVKNLPTSNIFHDELIRNFAYYAIYKDNIEIMDYMLKNYQIINLHDALTSAVHNQKLNMVKFLVEKGASFHPNANQLMIDIVHSCDLKLLKYVESLGFDPRFQDDKLFIEACNNYWGDVTIIRYLLTKGANINAQNNMALKKTLSNMLVSTPSGLEHFEKILQFLLDSGASTSGLSGDQYRMLQDSQASKS